MDFEKISIKQLHPATYNPRIMDEKDVLKLSKNLEEFGLVDPIIINLKNNHIIGGHQRYNILSQKYDEEHMLYLIRLGDIGWVFETTDLKIKDNNHEKALNLSLNSIDGKFNETELGMLLSELQTHDVDITLTGFDDYELLDYTLNYEMELLNEDTTETLNNDININETTIEKKDLIINIHLATEKQKQSLISLISRLKEAHPNSTIGSLLLQYLQKNNTQHKKITPYGIFFDNQQEYEEFKKLYETLKNNLKTDSFISLINEVEDLN